MINPSRQQQQSGEEGRKKRHLLPDVKNMNGRLGRKTCLSQHLIRRKCSLQTTALWRLPENRRKRRHLQTLRLFPQGRRGRTSRGQAQTNFPAPRGRARNIASCSTAPSRAMRLGHRPQPRGVCPPTAPKPPRGEGRPGPASLPSWQQGVSAAKVTEVTPRCTQRGGNSPLPKARWL